MDYEKKYKEALEKARKELQTCGSIDCDAARQIFRLFPELEIEDEKMWKLIKKYAHSNISDMALDADHITRKQLESWIEEQSNQRKQLIIKACNILVNCIEDYMLRRMEVWNEDCKNQTLENIRKKLEE